jgi:restriction system protein
MGKKGRRKRNQFSKGWLLLFIALLAFLRYPLLILTIIFIGVVYFIYRWKIRETTRKKILQSNIKEIDVMDGIEFEDFLATLYHAMGYTVQQTPASGDFGADLILKKDGRAIAVQAKRYNKTVGVEAVQQASSSKAYYKCTEAWVVTNNHFTKSAFELAKRSDVTLIDRGKLIDILTKDQKVI